MVVGRGQGPAQAATPVFIKGRVWTQNPYRRPYPDPTIAPDSAVQPASTHVTSRIDGERDQQPPRGRQCAGRLRHPEVGRLGQRAPSRGAVKPTSLMN